MPTWNCLKLNSWSLHILYIMWVQTPNPYESYICVTNSQGRTLSFPWTKDWNIKFLCLPLRALFFFFLNLGHPLSKDVVLQESQCWEGSRQGVQVNSLLCIGLRPCALFPQWSPRRSLRAVASFSTLLALWLCFSTLFNTSESYLYSLSSSAMHLKKGLFLCHAAFLAILQQEFRMSDSPYCETWEICNLQSFNVVSCPYNLDVTIGILLLQWPTSKHSETVLQ